MNRGAMVNSFFRAATHMTLSLTSDHLFISFIFIEMARNVITNILLTVYLWLICWLSVDIGRHCVSRPLLLIVTQTPVSARSYRASVFLLD